MDGLYGPIDALLTLRETDAVAIATTTIETLQQALVAAEQGDFKVVFAVSELDLANATETYVLTLEADAASNFGSPVTVASVTVTAVGIYEVPLSGALVERLEPGAIKVRCKATLGGDTPSIKYGCFISHGA